MKPFIPFILLLFSTMTISAQKPLPVKLVPVTAQQRILVTVQDNTIAEFLYPDTLEKPVLFNIHAPNGEVVTRGFPLAPKPGEATDHPHHVGLWLNYENVNGLDFWNNSYAIPADKKQHYGWIRTDSTSTRLAGSKAILTYTARWINQSGESLMKEETEFIFSATNNQYTIDRICTLTALVDVSMPDIKDGLLGFRVARALELPSAQSKEYADAQGRLTPVAANSSATGDYLTSEGKKGDSAWGTRARWCMLFGRMGTEEISITIIDHPRNPGYPTYWHARGYGLFAANPLGQKIFSHDSETLNFKLAKGQQASFRYRILIASGPQKTSAKEIERAAADFTAGK